MDRKHLISAIYSARRDRTAHPEGRRDNAGRWYPSDREAAEGSGTCVRTPSRAWPWSYMSRCRTRSHVTTLVDRALAGLDVPPDVASTLAARQAPATAA